MKKLERLNRAQMAQILAAFGGTFTGVFSALLTASCPPDYAAKKANEIAQDVDDDFNDPSGVVTPISINVNDGKTIVEYQSRSGKIYIFSLSNTWYNNELLYPSDSSLAESFEKIAASTSNERW